MTRTSWLLLVPSIVATSPATAQSNPAC